TRACARLGPGPVTGGLARPSTRRRAGGRSVRHAGPPSAGARTGAPGGSGDRARHPDTGYPPGGGRTRREPGAARSAPRAPDRILSVAVGIMAPMATWQEIEHEVPE